MQDVPLMYVNMSTSIHVVAEYQGNATVRQLMKHLNTFHNLEASSDAKFYSSLVPASVACAYVGHECMPVDSLYICDCACNQYAGAINITPLSFKVI